MAYEQKDMSGSMFPNDKKGNDKAAPIRKKIIQFFADGIKKAERVRK